MGTQIAGAKIGKPGEISESVFASISDAMKRIEAFCIDFGKAKEYLEILSYRDRLLR